LPHDVPLDRLAFGKLRPFDYLIGNIDPARTTCWYGCTLGACTRSRSIKGFRSRTAAWTTTFLAG
jgi:hypothetical protein